MAKLEKRDLKAIAEAVKSKHKEETFERALGRAIRKDKGDFERYIRVICAIRDYGQRNKVDIVTAAKMMSKE
jgi:hypothetical protein